MIDLQDPDIIFIENDILLKYRQTLIDHKNCDALMAVRKRIIDKIALEHQDEILQDIIDFNDALRDALKEMYDRAHSIWNRLADKQSLGDTVQLVAKCYLDYDYPKLHPRQDESREDLWSALLDEEWNPIYSDSGCSLSPLVFPLGLDQTFDHFIGMDCPPPNWNEGLDPELTKDLHLTSAFNNLFECSNYAITDFIYVRKFQTEINIEIRKKV